MITIGRLIPQRPVVAHSIYDSGTDRGMSETGKERRPVRAPDIAVPLHEDDTSCHLRTFDWAIWGQVTKRETVVQDRSGG